MSEKRGYPNPNYTEEDILPGIPMEVKTELLLDDQLVEYIQKAAMLDCLAATIKAMGKVDVDVVRALTGTIDPKENEELEQFRSWWHQERDANDGLKKKVAELEHARVELIEILRQNHIGPYAEEDKEESEITEVSE